MSTLDMTVVNVALNTLARGFRSPLPTIQWVATGYTLALAAVVPLSGWAQARFGSKRLFLIAIGLFVAGSALSGAAWSTPSLIAFRVLQGLGGGMLGPASMTVLARAAGPERIGRVMGIISVPIVLGPIMGPVLGGWLVTDVSWRAIFYLNVPVGAVALAVAFIVLDRDTPQPGERLDMPGLLMLSPGLAALIYGLARGAGSGFGAAGALAPAVAGAVLVAAFVVRALTARNPLIDLRLLRRRSAAAGSGALALFMAAYVGSMLLVPLYYQVVRGETPLVAGLLLIPEGVGAMITMPIGGKLTDRVGPGRVAVLGVTVVTAAMATFASLLGAATPLWALSTALLGMGMGLGLTMIATLGAAVKPLAHHEVPSATTMIGIIQQVAASSGIAAASLLLSSHLASRLGAAGTPGAAAGLQTVRNVPVEARVRIAGLMAEAFQSTYWWLPVPLLALAIIPALILWRRPRAVAARAASGAELELRETI
jgi:EmrB/QacA subfamily drug resistance transporter